MASILTDSTWQAEVRKLIGAKSGTLSDADLASDLFLGTAEGRVKQLIPTWSTILSGSNTNEIMALKNATKAYVAFFVLLTPGYEQEHTALSLRTTDLAVDRLQESIESKRTRILAFAHQELSRIQAFIDDATFDVISVASETEIYTDSETGLKTAQWYYPNKN